MYYELSNHLGNVLTTVTGRKQGIDENSDNIVDYYKPEVVQASDYYPFGSEMPGRTYKNPLFSGTNEYRFGFNGKELYKSGEFGSLTHYDYGFRIYNPSIGKFLSVDPLTRSYPWYTPYQFAGNTPIWAVDLDGLEPLFTTEKDAQRVANDINAIFYNKYKTEESKTALFVQETLIRQKNPDYGLWDRYGWGSDPEYIDKKVWKIMPSENFNWETDVYTASLKDVLILSSPTYVQIYQDSPRKLQKGESGNDYLWNTIYGWGGGEVTYFPKIRLSKQCKRPSKYIPR